MIVSDSIIHDIPPVSSNKPTLSLYIYISNAWRTNNPRVSIEFPYILSRKIPGFTDANLSPLPLFSKKRKKKKEESNIRGKDKRNRDIEKRNETTNIFNKSRNGRREGRERNGNPLVVQESFCSARVFASGARSSVGK